MSMAYNLGLVGLNGFHGTLAAIRAKNWSAAGLHMLDSKWARQVGSRATRLAAQMQTGVAQ